MINYGQPSRPGYARLLPKLPPLSRHATRYEKRVYRRDVLIYLARRQGLTHEFIAEAFALSSSFVREVVCRLAIFEEKPEDRRRQYARVSSLPEKTLLRGAANAGKRARARRNLVIRLAHQHGFSQRALAEVFDLPRSWIATIVKAEHC
jgi:transposase